MRVPAYSDRRFASPPTTFEEVDVRGLEHDLGRAVEGEVRFRPGDRALYTTGGSNYRQLPIGVVIPRTTDDVVETMRVCRDYRAPVLAHGGGTSLAGQCCNVAVVCDLSQHLHRILEIDPAAGGPAYVLTDDYNPIDDLQRPFLVALREDLIRKEQSLLLFDGTLGQPVNGGPPRWAPIRRA